ncbi:FecR family protein [Dyadobacter sp. CY323]|uniref:FecR family protein n=1 Tax=Dyadobacter sp. CY323 TaxID=2907302 RepID=UPI001F1A6F2A|nr:FecR family protein [Dyadobacter sp. CY323]MCE6990166.1 FecR family protein [Dyadobacter sp. CY323]
MIEKYATYSVEDFVRDELFIEWVKTPDPRRNALWQRVVDTYPGQKPVIRQARQIVAQLSEASRAPFYREDAVGIWNSIDNELFTSQINFGRKSIYRSLWMAAASILVLLGLGWAVYNLPNNRESIGYDQLVRKTENKLKEVANTGEKTLMVNLPDGSRVYLQKDSKLSYASDFSGKTRDVFLSGAAFFDVTKNPEKPFIVYANELVTKVLGTSFTISAFDRDSKVTVAVKTGKVSVFANRYVGDVDPETKGIILIPNQQADFQRKSETISRSLVEQPKVVIAKKELEKFAFNNAPVAEIFAAMESAYGVDFLFDHEVLSECRLTTSLSEETLFERLDVICEAIGATYKVVDAQIVITGRKCN